LGDNIKIFMHCTAKAGDSTGGFYEIQKQKQAHIDPARVS
jgi:hypothetical protein